MVVGGWLIVLQISKPFEENLNKFKRLPDEHPLDDLGGSEVAHFSLLTKLRRVVGGSGGGFLTEDAVEAFSVKPSQWGVQRVDAWETFC